MPVSVSMPQLGESVTEGTVTRWLKREGDHVDADEPLLEVSTDKVDTEIPSPVSGTLRGITVAEDETVAVGAELAVIDEDGAGGEAQPATFAAGATTPEPSQQDLAASAAGDDAGTGRQQAWSGAAAGQPPGYPEPGYPDSGQEAGYPGQGQAEAGYPGQGQAEAGYPGQGQAEARYPQPEQAAYPPGHFESGYQEPHPAAGYPDAGQPAAAYQQADGVPGAAGSDQAASGYEEHREAPSDHQIQDQPPEPAAPQQPGGPEHACTEAQPGSGIQGGQDPSGIAAAMTEGADGPYVTPLVRKLAAEHGIHLAAVTGTGVGGRIRKQDVLDAARARGGQAPAPAGPQAAPAPAAAQPAAQIPAAQPAAVQAQVAQAHPAPAGGAGTAPRPGPAQQGRPAVEPSRLRGRTERLSRARQVIAQRMVESLQTSAQLTTVVEADVTAIARLRDRAKSAFETREGVKLSFLPFFALAALEALKVHPELNAVIDTAAGTVTYHDSEHLGIAVDTDRGLMVPVIRNAGDLNIGGLARKIADLAQRTRAGQVSPDELAGGTFTLTNTGSRGALFDTPIINQPQVGILGTGTVNRRAVVVQEPALGEVITVRSIVYLALTYDHRLVDGADAARYLVTVKSRLEEGSFEAELGL